MRGVVFGIGYVGLVQAAVLAEMGHQVTCVNVDGCKVARLEEGSIPIFEPRQATMVLINHQAGHHGCGRRGDRYPAHQHQVATVPSPRLRADQAPPETTCHPR